MRPFHFFSRPFRTPTPPPPPPQKRRLKKSSSKRKEKKKKDPAPYPPARVQHDRAEFARAGHGLGEVGQRAAVEVEGAPLVFFFFSFPPPPEREQESERERRVFPDSFSMIKKERNLFPHRQVASRDRGPGVEQVAEGVDVVAGRADGDDDCFGFLKWREKERGGGGVEVEKSHRQGQPALRFRPSVEQDRRVKKAECECIVGSAFESLILVQLGSLQGTAAKHRHKARKKAPQQERGADDGKRGRTIEGAARCFLFVPGARVRCSIVSLFRSSPPSAKEPFSILPALPSTSTGARKKATNLSSRSGRASSPG